MLQSVISLQQKKSMKTEETNRRSGDQEICQDLSEKIIHLTYMPGEVLSEHELAARFGATRHTIRKALAVLQQKRLIEVYPQRGTYVTLLDIDQVKNIMFLRAAAEIQAANLLMDQEDTVIAENCRIMETCIQSQKMAMQEAEDGQLTEAFETSDAQFHAQLFRAVGRETACHMLDDEMNLFYRWRNLELRLNDRLPEIIHQHEELLQMLKNREREGFRQLMNQHIDTNYFEEIGARTNNRYFYKKS